MATSGEAVMRYTFDDLTCFQPMRLFGFEDLTCHWEGTVDVYVDEDDSAVYTCGNGHENQTTWGELV